MKNDCFRYMPSNIFDFSNIGSPCYRERHVSMLEASQKTIRSRYGARPSAASLQPRSGETNQWTKCGEFSNRDAQAPPVSTDPCLGQIWTNDTLRRRTQCPE